MVVAQGRVRLSLISGDHINIQRLQSMQTINFLSLILGHLSMSMFECSAPAVVELVRLPADGA